MQVQPGAGAEGRHLRRHHRGRDLRRRAEGRRRGAEGREHPVHAARHRRALSLHAAVRRRPGGHDAKRKWRSRTRRRSASCRRNPRPKRQRGRTSTGHRGRPRRTRRGLFPPRVGGAVGPHLRALSRAGDVGGDHRRGRRAGLCAGPDAGDLRGNLARSRGTLGPRPRMDAGIDSRRRGRARDSDMGGTRTLARCGGGLA